MSNRVPEGWEQKLLKDTVSAVISGQSPNRKDHAARAGKYGILKTTAIDWGKYSPDKNQEVLDDFKVNPKHEVKTGDILITKAGPVHRVGVVTYIPATPEKMLVSGKMTLLRTDSLHESRFVSYALSTEYSQKPLKESTTGMALSQTNFTHETLLQVPLWVPDSLPEQQKIAAILSSVDDVIEKTRAHIDKLKDLKTGMMQELLTKGIGHTEFKDSPVGRIPSSWDVRSLGEVCDLQVGYAFKSTWFSERGVKLLRGDNVGYGNPTWERTRYLSEEKLERFQDYLLSAGDLIIGMDRTFTNSGTKLSRLNNSDTPALLVQRVGRFIPKNIRKDFLWHLLRSTSFTNALKGEEKGMDIPHLSKSEILTPLIPLPPTEEQRQVAVALTSIDDVLATKERKLHRVKKLKKALMQDLLTGKVRVKVEQKESAVA